MSDTGCGNKRRIVLLSSLALNIFLIAFVLGRLSVGAMMPPPFFEGRDRPHMPFGDMHGGMPPPPPFFSPANLFTPDEMKQDFIAMQDNFNKMRALRQDFSHQLEASPVSKADVLKHFAEIDALMDSVRKQTQQKAAERISTMSQEERQRFAKHLLDKP